MERSLSIYKIVDNLHVYWNKQFQKIYFSENQQNFIITALKDNKVYGIQSVISIYFHSEQIVIKDVSKYSPWWNNETINFEIK